MDLGDLDFAPDLNLRTKRAKAYPYKYLPAVLREDPLAAHASPTYRAYRNQYYLDSFGELTSVKEAGYHTLPLLPSIGVTKKLGASLAKIIGGLPKQAHADFYTIWRTAMGPLGYTAAHPPNAWFASKETIDTLKRMVQFSGNNNYANDAHYFVDRCGIPLDLPLGVVALAPSPEDLGVKVLRDDTYNFVINADNMKVFQLNQIKIGSSKQRRSKQKQAEKRAKAEVVEAAEQLLLEAMKQPLEQREPAQVRVDSLPMVDVTEAEEAPLEEAPPKVVAPPEVKAPSLTARVVSLVGSLVRLVRG